MNKIFIDKTKVLEEGITDFPSLFIEGAAACGKSTVVNMFLEAHPDVHSDVFFMDKEMNDFASFKERLDACQANETGKKYVVFDNINRELDSDFYREMSKFIFAMPDETRAFLVSREKPAQELLELLWKGQMGMVFQKSLVFTASEVAKFFSGRQRSLQASEVYRITGGWPGCVDVIARLSVLLGPEHYDSGDVEALYQRYEVQEYIQSEILDSLSAEEAEIMRRADICPWVNEELCEEVWRIMWPGTILKDLERKGLLIYNEQKRRWKLAPLFRATRKTAILPNLRKCLGKWYEEHGAIEEALQCLDDESCKSEYQEYIIKHFDVVPFISLLNSDIMEWKGNVPQLCYLRGMYCYLKQDFSGLRKEMMKVQRLEGKLASEVYLNLTYVDPELPIEIWLALLEEMGTKCAPIRLYHFAENASVFSTGWRELSGLFACSANEEKRRRRLLKTTLGEKEWIGIQFAYIDFSMEIRRKDVLQGPIWEDVLRVVNGDIENLTWRYKVVCLYLLSKSYIVTPDPKVGEQVKKLEESLRGEENELCQRYVYAVSRLHSLWHSEGDKATRWLQKISSDVHIEVSEDNYYLLFLRAKGFLLLNQHDHAERIIKRLIPYVQKYHRTRLLAELLFQQAIVEWADGKRGAALRSVVESFLYTGEFRYVTFYIIYGKIGKEVLEAYVDWRQKNEPEKWHKKKKYNYGNVLRMPMEDYLGFILRAAKRGLKSYPNVTEQDVVEKLTMMETIILQDINKGLTNAEICEELNLKLPTVKTHIYSVYKKLGVNSRVQAILKGKELGLVK